MRKVIDLEMFGPSIAKRINENPNFASNKFYTPHWTVKFYVCAYAHTKKKKGFFANKIDKIIVKREINQIIVSVFAERNEVIKI